MYTIEYLPSAMQDMVDIVRYISQELQNPDAANRLATGMIESAEKVSEFPYSCPPYIPMRPLKHEYRKLIVGNYIMFYWVNEKDKAVTFTRVIYAKRNLRKQLDETNYSEEPI